MKLTLTNLIALASLTLLSLPASGRTLTPDEALARAMGSQPARVAATTTSRQLLHTINTTSGSPAVYVFSSGADEMMLLGADDLAQPVLAYGIKANAFTRIPENVMWWLGEYAREISYAKDQESCRPVRVVSEGELPQPVIQERTIMPTANASMLKPLMKSVWNQGEPFNLRCPKIEGQLPPTGCTATAMAQIMYYHRWPERGTGSGYATANGVRYNKSLNIKFKWDEMLDSYNGPYTTDQGDAVAALMMACGYGAQMGYGLAGSGASTQTAGNALMTNFYYAPDVMSVDRDYYTVTEWKELLRTELNVNGPILYSGYNPDGGHAFVFDGYNADSYFHVNWGWGGAWDGYFRVDGLNPSGQGIGGFEGGYNQGQNAIVGIHKPGEGYNAVTPRFISYTNQVRASFANNFLTLDGHWIMSYNTVEMQVAIELTHLRKKYYFIESEEYTAYKPGDNISSISAEITATIPDGIYEARLVSRQMNEKTWLRALVNTNNNYVDYATVKVADGKMMPYSAKPILEEAYIHDYFRVDAPGDYTVRVANVNEEDQTMRVALCYREVNSSDFIQCAPETIIIPGGQTKDVVFSYNIEATESLTSGHRVELRLVDADNGDLLYGLGQHDIYAPGDEVPVAGARIHSYRYIGNLNAVNQSDMTFRATVSYPSIDRDDAYFYLVYWKETPMGYQSRGDYAYSEHFNMEKGKRYDIEFSHLSNPDLEIGDRVMVGIYQQEKYVNIDGVTITITADAGVESVLADASAGGVIDIAVEKEQVNVRSVAPITSVRAFAPNGVVLPLLVSYDGADASASLTGISGMVLIEVTDALGHRSIMKAFVK